MVMGTLLFALWWCVCQQERKANCLIKLRCVIDTRKDYQQADKAPTNRHHDWVNHGGGVLRCFFAYFAKLEGVFLRRQ